MPNELARLPFCQNDSIITLVYFDIQSLTKTISLSILFIESKVLWTDMKSGWSFIVAEIVLYLSHWWWQCFMSEFNATMIYVHKTLQHLFLENSASYRAQMLPRIRNMRQITNNPIQGSNSINFGSEECISIFPWMQWEILMPRNLLTYAEY